MGTDHCEWLRGGTNTVGVDLTPRHLELCRENAKGSGFAATLARADAEDLPFATESFDVVYSFGVLHHTPDTQRAIDELWRVLRPGGLARVMLYYRHSENFWLNMVVRHGLLRGELFRDSIDGILSRWAETPDSRARPLVKVYSKRDARLLFRRFGKVHCSIHQLTGLAHRALAPFGPVAVRWFEQRAGWNLVVEARK
jgi:SAM-dependent methyltransferase